MSQAMQYSFRLFGPRKGQSITINGHPFTNGIYNAVVGADAASTLMSVLSYYGAFAHGTPKYYEALEKEEAANGASDVSASTGSGAAEPLPDGVRPIGAGPSAQEAVAGNGHVDSETGGAGADPSGDGHGHTRIPKFEEAASRPEPNEPASVGNETLRKAVMQLNPEIDTHWVMTGAHKGMPKLSAVEDAYGRAGVTRQDIEAAIPNWNRERAVETVLEA